MHDPKYLWSVIKSNFTLLSTNEHSVIILTKLINDLTYNCEMYNEMLDFINDNMNILA